METVLLGDGTLIRTYRTAAGVLRLASFDLIRRLCPGCNPWQKFATLVQNYPEFAYPGMDASEGKVSNESVHGHPAVQRFISTLYQFPGQGQRPTPTVDFEGGLQLIMVLPGVSAAECRKQVADLLTRAIAGDESLVGEIRANAKSDGVLPTLAREHLEAEGRPAKRMKGTSLDIVEKQISLAEKMERMLGDGMDDYMMLKKREWLRNTLLEEIYDSPAALPDKATAKAIEDAEPLTISTHARRLGFTKVLTGQQQKEIGRIVGKAYRQRYEGKAPPKKPQQHDGRVIDVNAYTMRDADLVEVAIRAVVGE